MKNHAAVSKIGSPQKNDFRADGDNESHPAAWELKRLISNVFKFFPENYC